MKLSFLALPLSVAFLALSLQTQEPATLVHIDGTVHTQETADGEHIQLTMADTYTVPVGKILQLEALIFGNGQDGTVYVTIDNVHLVQRAFQNHSPLNRANLQGLQVAAGAVVTMLEVSNTSALNSHLIATLVDV